MQVALGKSQVKELTTNFFDSELKDTDFKSRVVEGQKRPDEDFTVAMPAGSIFCRNFVEVSGIKSSHMNGSNLDKSKKEGGFLNISTDSLFKICRRERERRERFYIDLNT